MRADPPSNRHQDQDQKRRVAYSLADLAQEFITSRGWTQCQVAKKTRELENAVPHNQRELVRSFSNSCLSRWKTAIDKPVLRHQFVSVAYASAHLEWESSGEEGEKPGLGHMLDLWERRHPPSPFIKDNNKDEAGKATETQPAPASTPAPERPQIDLSDSAQIKALRSYGVTGMNLLTAARAGDQRAALDYALLRALDGHRQESQGWFRAASADDVLEQVAVQYYDSLPSLAEIAVERAAALPDDGIYQERRALLLERAATHRSPRAADLFADHLERRGEQGAAARWRAMG
ncbi:hypothetical protein [Nocardiopsis salina]|uniref:hypothetical protein n=1 Tax=Nocardiopsis salina TaxID=245836 RepID=UPI0003491724|nr:hypothetical protein [Nocardiopsis salina]